MAAMIQFAQDMDTETGEYEIVGIYDYRELYQRTVTRNFTYIPASVVPEGFQGASAETVSTERFYFQMEDIVPPSAAPLPYPGAVSFVLTSPDEEARFMAETRSDLEHMGFRASFLDNGLEDFRAAAGPMRQSSLYNALIYSAILLAAFALAAFVYFFLRRRELAIVRALGVPVKTCVKQISLPLGLIGLPGVLLGGTLGWRYTLVNAAKTLEALAEFGDGSVSALPVYWLILLWASAAALLLALTVGSAAMLSRRPVLEQMQGGSAVKEKRRTARQDAIAASGGGVRVSELSFEAAALERVSDILAALESPPLLYGVGSTAQVIAGLERGSITAAVAQNDFSVGYLAVEQAACLARRRTPAQRGELRFFTVRKENIREPEYQKLLFPVIW